MVEVVSKYRKYTLTAVLAIAMVTVGGLFQGSLMSNTYSAAPALFYEGEPVTVYGQVVFHNRTPASNIEVRLFAVDELFEEFVLTDFQGYFYSNSYFEAGQYVKVEVNGMRLFSTHLDDVRQDAFVEYDAIFNDRIYLGIYVLAP